MKGRGFIQLHRELLDHWVFQDPITLKVFLYFLLTANFEDKQTIFNNKPIMVKRGQFIYGRKVFSHRLNITEKVLRRVVKNLVKDDMLGQQTTTQYSVFTIKNYDHWQHWANEGPTQGQARANAGPHLNNVNNDNKGSKVKKVEKSLPTLDQVKEFCLKENLAIDAEYYFNSQEAVGWVNKNGQKVKSWKASIKTWNRNEIKWNGGRTNNNQPELGV